jgi:hypothetical protein
LLIYCIADRPLCRLQAGAKGARKLLAVCGLINNIYDGFNKVFSFGGKCLVKILNSNLSMFYKDSNLSKVRFEL